MRTNGQNEKKRGGKFDLLTWGAALLLLIGGGGFALYEAGVIGDDWLNVMGGDDAVDIIGETGVVNLTISGAAISWNGETISRDELVKRVADLEEDATFTLTNDQAIKDTYEDVMRILEQNNLAFQETESL